MSIVVPDLDAAARALESEYGLKIGPIAVNTEQSVCMAYVEFPNAKIELMELSRADSPVMKFLEKIRTAAFITSASASTAWTPPVLRRGARARRGQKTTLHSWFFGAARSRDGRIANPKYRCTEYGGSAQLILSTMLSHVG